ncbi:MAG TPA: CHC2 zinc finger domain-containing protein [Terriglobia bacterium]|nr:CHC2 zinc finger domain-containing protein [Terriglobia bacterium]
MTQVTNVRDAALAFHQRLPKRLWQYLNERGISNDLIHRNFLGWNGRRITIPVPDRNGIVEFLKLAKDPDDSSNSPKMIATPGARADIYGWERVIANSGQLIICEGEFDRLVLESHGFAAVTSTCGAGVFRQEWAEEIKRIPEVYVCFDRDATGRTGALRIGRMIPHAKLVELPEEVGDGGDVTDFFVRLGRTREDFLKLLEAAQAAPKDPEPKLKSADQDFKRRATRNEVERIKNSVRIENVVSRYVSMSRAGKTITGHCPFHDDRIPSFVVYPATQSFYCFGCRAHGDVASFLMRIEKLTFPEVLRTLQKIT